MEILQVRDLMTREVVTARANQDLATLHDLMMDKHIRHIPIVDEDNDVVGIVSHRDLVGNALSGNQQLPVTELRQMLKDTKVREIMVTGVETIEQGAGIEEAAQIMLDNKYGCIPVTDNGHLVGILTESDFVRCVADEQRELKKVEGSSRGPDVA